MQAKENLRDDGGYRTLFSGAGTRFVYATASFQVVCFYAKVNALTSVVVIAVLQVSAIWPSIKGWMDREAKRWFWIEDHHGNISPRTDEYCEARAVDQMSLPDCAAE